MFGLLPRAYAGRVARRPLWVAMLAALLLPTVAPEVATAKTPGKTYCFKGTCHTVKTLDEMTALVGREETVTATFYDTCKRDRYNPCGLTSSGEKVRPNDADNAASPIYPDGTVVLLWNPATGQAATVRITNAGPYWGKARKLDVSRATAEKLGFKKKGQARLAIKIISAPTREESRYKKNRRYDAVPGALGEFPSMAAAETGMKLAMATTPAPQRLAASDVDLAKSPVADDETPASGLRAAARRALGLEPAARRVAPSTLTADALYARMTQKAL